MDHVPASEVISFQIPVQANAGRVGLLTVLLLVGWLAVIGAADFDRTQTLKIWNKNKPKCFYRIFTNS